MTVCEKLELVSRTVDEAKTVPQGEMVLRQMKDFTGKLPKYKAFQIMTDLIFTVNAPKDTRPNNLFMHTTSSGPSPTNSLKPAHPEEGISTREK